MVCVVLLTKLSRVIWSLDSILTERKNIFSSFWVFLVWLASFLTDRRSCKWCLMQFSRNCSQFQTEIMSNFFHPPSASKHMWGNKLHRREPWGVSLQCDCAYFCSVWGCPVRWFFCLSSCWLVKVVLTGRLSNKCVGMEGQETVAFILISLIRWMTQKVKIKSGNLLLLSLSLSVWLLPSALALQWPSLKGHTGAAAGGQGRWRKSYQLSQDT